MKNNPATTSKNKAVIMSHVIANKFTTLFWNKCSGNLSSDCRVDNSTHTYHISIGWRETHVPFLSQSKFWSRFSFYPYSISLSYPLSLPISPFIFPIFIFLKHNISISGRLQQSYGSFSWRFNKRFTGFSFPLPRSTRNSLSNYYFDISKCFEY